MNFFIIESSFPSYIRLPQKVYCLTMNRYIRAPFRLSTPMRFITFRMSKKVRAAFLRSKQIQRVIQIDRLPDVQLIFRPGHVMQQKFQNQRTPSPRPSILKWENPHRQIDVLNVAHADKPRIGHRSGKR